MGPATKTCQQKAIGKFNAIVVIHLIKRLPFIPLKRAVATKLIIGHIKTTVDAETANIVRPAFLPSGETIVNASFLAAGPPINDWIIKTIAVNKIISSGGIINEE